MRRINLPPLHWRSNDHDGVSNHQPHGCLLNRLFRGRSKKTSKFRVTGLCVGNSPGPVNSPHKGPVTRKMLPFDDVIMRRIWVVLCFVVVRHHTVMTLWRHTMETHSASPHLCKGNCLNKYHKTSSISRTKSQNLNVSCLLLQWSLPNPLKPGVKLRMKM